MDIYFYNNWLIYPISAGYVYTVVEMDAEIKITQLHQYEK